MNKHDKSLISGLLLRLSPRGAWRLRNVRPLGLDLGLSLVLFLSALSLAVGQTQTVVWQEYNFADTSSASLTGTSSGNSWHSGGASQQVLYAADNGYVEYTCDNQTNKYKTFGLALHPDIWYAYTVIDYGFYFRNNGTVYITENGSQTYVGTYASGQVYTVDKTGTKITFKRNGSTVATRDLTGSNNFHVLAGTYQNGAVFSNMQVSFGAGINVQADILGASLDGSTGGSIDLTVSGGVAPYTYQWNHTLENTADVDLLTPGLYTVTVTDDSSNSETIEYAVGYALEWTDLTYTSADASGNLSSSGPTGWNAGAASTNMIPAHTDGWLRFTGQSDFAYQVMGLSIAPHAGYGKSTIDYGFYFNSSSYAEIILHGATKRKFATHADAHYRLEREGNTLYWYRDDFVMWSETVPTDEVLVADAAFYLSGKSFDQVLMSSDSRLLAVQPTYTHNTTWGETSAVLNPNPTHGVAPYHYVWSDDGSTEGTRTALETGLYTVQISDANGQQSTRTFGAGFLVTWENLTGASSSAAGEITYSGSGWGGGTSLNRIHPNEDAWLEYVVNDGIMDTRLLGFTAQGNSGTAFSETAYAFYLHSTGILYYVEGGSTVSMGSYAAGDVLRLERRGDKIYYYRNDEEIRQVSTTPSQELAIDAGLLGGSFMDVHCSVLPHGVTATAETTHLSLYQVNGAVDASVYGGYPPYDFSWSNGDTIEDLDSLASGTYNLIVTDSLGGKDTLDVEVNEYVSLTNPILGRVEGLSTFEKLGTADQWDAGAVSENTIASGDNGWAGFAISDTAHRVFIALSDGYTGSWAPTDQKYTLVMDGGYLYRYIDGVDSDLVLLTDGQSPYTVEAGDGLAITRTTAGAKTDISFRLNGVAISSWQAPNDLEELGVLVGAKTPGARIPGLVGSFRPSTLSSYLCDLNNDGRNWMRVVSFDENGNEVGEAITFKDGFGRAYQVQSKAYEEDNVIVMRTAYDEFGRQVAVTLPAPVYQSDPTCYRSRFMTNAAGEDYTWRDFDQFENGSDIAAGITPGHGMVQQVQDGLGGINNPNPLSQSVQGTLGWYYSNQNTDEAYVAASAYPYSRMEYYPDARGRVKRNGAPGEELRLGAGHEGQAYYLRSGGELQYVFGNNAKPSLKLVEVDAEGRVNVVFTTVAGKRLANARSGLGSTCDTQISNVQVGYKLRSHDMHLPDGMNEFHVQLDVARGVNDINTLDLYLYNLKNNARLSEGTDYTVTADGAGRYRIDMIGSFASGHQFIRFAYEYHSDVVSNFYEQFYAPPTMPSLWVEQELDYSHWNLHFYDRADGLRTKTIQPKGVDCDDFQPGSPMEFTDFDEMNDLYDNGYQLNTSTLTFDEHENTTLASNEEHKNYFELSVAYKSIDADALGSVSLYNECTGYATTFKDPDLSTAPIGLGVDASRTVQYGQAGPDLGSRAIGRKSTGKYGGTGGYKILEDQTGNGYDPCNSMTHCTNGVQDCGETGVDIGGGCANDPCYDTPDEKQGTFRFKVQLYGDLGGGSFEVIDRQGSNADATAHDYFYGSLWRTCNCEYYFTADEQTVYGNFTNSILNTYDRIEVRVTEINVQSGINSTWQAFNPSGNNHHDFARFFVLRRTGHYRIEDNVVNPTHNGFENTYGYDDRELMVSTTTPDEGKSETTYDQRRRPVFSQSAQQAADDQFGYVVYDGRSRAIETGVYKDAGNGTTYTFQNHEEMPASTNPTLPIIDDVTQLFDDQYGNCAACQERVYSFYDLPASDFPTSSFPTYKQRFLTGLLSRMENDEEITWYSYDEQSRLSFTIRYVKDLQKYFTMQYTYSFTGNLLETVFQAEVPTERFYHHYNYDADQRLESVYTSFDGVLANARLEAGYEYYMHGAMKRQELGTDLQGLDYVYTITGALKSINAPELSNRDPGQDGYNGTHQTFAADVFGMTMDYFQGDYQRNGTHVQTLQTIDDESQNNANLSGLYDGNARSIRWQLRHPGIGTALHEDNKQLAYVYRYDEQGQLRRAQFGTITAQGSQNAVIPVLGGYAGPTASFSTDYGVANISYDQNGNIQSLERSGYTASGNGLAMDDLTYQYSATNNRLDHVDDAVTGQPYGDDATDQASGNYSYDASGRIISDAQKQVHYAYNHRGRMEGAYHDALHTQPIIRVKYNSAGQRLKKTTYDTQGTITGETWYINDAAGGLVANYDGSGVNLTQTDLALYGASRLGFHRRSTGDTRYELTDHLGNIRAVIDGAKDGGTNDVVVLDVNDFYPYGYVMPGRRVVGAEGHLFGFQGQEYDPETGMNAFNLRMYDPRLGRWLSADPFREFYSSYLGMGNNPIRFTDPTGGYTWDMAFGGGTDDGNGSEGDPPVGTVTLPMFEVVAEHPGFSYGPGFLHIEGGLLNVHDELQGRLGILQNSNGENFPSARRRIKYTQSQYDLRMQIMNGGSHHLKQAILINENQGNPIRWSLTNYKRDISIENDGTGEFWLRTSAAAIRETILMFNPITAAMEAPSLITRGAAAAKSSPQVVKLMRTLIGTFSGGKSKAAAGAIKLGPTSDTFIRWASKARQIPGELNVVGHGAPNLVQIGDALVDHRALANLIKRNPQFSGQPIRLLSCNTGKCANGLAQNLANKLNVKVWAPNDLIWANPQGRLFIGPTATQNTGKFVPFVPFKP